MEQQYDSFEYADTEEYSDNGECRSLQPISGVSGAMSFNDKVMIAQQGLEKAGQVMKSIENIYAMRQRTKQIKELTKVQLANTVAKYKVCHEFLDKTFGERHEALQKHYDLLDDAVAKGDRELILASLHGISDIVTTSPLSELQRLAQIFDDTSVPLLDF